MLSSEEQSLLRLEVFHDLELFIESRGGFPGLGRTTLDGEVRFTGVTGGTRVDVRHRRGELPR